MSLSSEEHKAAARLIERQLLPRHFPTSPKEVNQQEAEEDADDRE